MLKMILLSPSVWKEWIEISRNDKQGNGASSPSVWKEWIEILISMETGSAGNRLLPFGRSGLKYNGMIITQQKAESPSVWKEWIEIEIDSLEVLCDEVSPSVWKEWIEISNVERIFKDICVSFRLERVD